MSERTTMERRLYEASLSGDVKELERLEEEDRLLLDRVSLMCSDETPLHIAALRGHYYFTRALLSRKPKLATELDSLRCTPLHLASAEGHHEIVRQLLDANAEVCKARNKDGRTPLHLAAMKGRVEVIKLLIRASPESIGEKLLDSGGGEVTVLHSCVKHNRLEALRTLVDEILLSSSSDHVELINSPDIDGNSILHLAAALKQVDTVEYLLQVKSVKEEANTKNKNGCTAMDVVEQCPNRDLKSMEIREFLVEAGVPKRTRDRTNNNNPQTHQQLPLWKSILKRCNMCWKKYFKVENGWFKEVRGHLITASTLTATMAYQAGLSPPGSVWQDNPPDTNQTTTKSDFDYDYSSTHEPGTSILASSQYSTYNTFLFFNTASLIASLGTLILALSGFPHENKVFIFLMMTSMFFSITCMAFAYLLTLGMISPLEIWDHVSSITTWAFVIWVAIVLFLVIVQIIHGSNWLWHKFKQLINRYKFGPRIKKWATSLPLPLARPRPPRNDHNNDTTAKDSTTTTTTRTFSICI